MRIRFGSATKTRSLRPLIVVIVILLALATGALFPAGINTFDVKAQMTQNQSYVRASSTVVSLNVSRNLPVYVGVGTTFNVVISFTSHANQFGLIGVVDGVPSGWTATVDKTWCTPNASEAIANEIGAQYAWYGSYDVGVEFTVVYKVTVPADASPGTYAFANGDVGYKIGSEATTHVSIGGDSQVQVNAPTPTPEPTPTTIPTPTLSPTPTSIPIDGGDGGIPVPTRTPTPTLTTTPVHIPTPTPTITATPPATQTATPTIAPTSTLVLTPTPTPTLTSTPVPTQTATAALTPTPILTITPTPTPTPPATQTNTQTPQEPTSVPISDGEDSGIQWWVWLLISLAAIGAAAGIVWLLRKHPA